MKELLKSSLLPLYTALLNQVTTSKAVYTFCMQWGKTFPTKEYSGLLFVGKATNGWITNSREVNVLFGITEERIFDRGDQMQWVNNLEGDKAYNTRKSAFWRVIKHISRGVNGQEEWQKKIAWSNLYKLSYEKGNPDAFLKEKQMNLCKKILAEEIRILSPKYVIFLTSGWEQSFINSFKPESIGSKESVRWGNKKYEVKVFEIDSVFYICSQHPQGKNEGLHAKAIIELIKKYNVRIDDLLVG